MSSAITFPTQSRLAQGWNTWSTRSVLSHVLLPEGLALNLSFHHYGMLAHVSDAFFGTREQRATAGVRLAPADIKAKQVIVKPGPHAFDGSYTALTVILGEVMIQVESAHVGPTDIVLLVTPAKADFRAPALGVNVGMLWNRPGHVEAAGTRDLRARVPSGDVDIHFTAEPADDPNIIERSPSRVFSLISAVGISTGAARTFEEIKLLVETARVAEKQAHHVHGMLAEAHSVSNACLAWNTIYEPAHRRVLTTSSRPWNVLRFGYGVFCWDNFFYAWMMAYEQPALARNIALETFRDMVDGEFVPNAANGSGRRSSDRSQPPIGSLAVLALHEISPDLTFLAQIWPALLAWNRWWHRSRRNPRGLLSWGSHPATPRIGDLAEILQPNTAYGASLESGMDNSPMYDDVPFDSTTHLLALSDVGLVSLYVIDCEALSALGRELGLEKESAELDARGVEYATKLRELWNPTAGIYQNRRTDTDAFSPRLSPTLFYPLLAGVATPEQAATMVKNHLLNEQEFWGDWVLPSISRNDPAFADQKYWRGRIWAPLNFFVYLGLKRAGYDQPAKELALRSRQMFEQSWRDRSGVFENYSALTGEGGEAPLCDPMYPWTGLFVFMGLMEAGTVPLPSLMRGPRKT